jgi:hypothetical protein
MAVGSFSLDRKVYIFPFRTITNLDEPQKERLDRARARDDDGARRARGLELAQARLARRNRYYWRLTEMILMRHVIARSR